MYVEIGVVSTTEEDDGPYRGAIAVEVDSASGTQQVRTLEGARTVRLSVPGDRAPMTALQEIAGALNWHLASGTTPVWVESDSEEMRKAVAQHFGLPVTKSRRPKDWDAEEPRPEAEPGVAMSASVGRPDGDGGGQEEAGDASSAAPVVSVEDEQADSAPESAPEDEGEAPLVFVEEQVEEDQE
jgi:hypothetical protein